MPKLHLVRHAEPERTGVLLGSCDPGLSEAGRRNAAVLVLDVHVVYVSELRRARETVSAMSGRVPIVVMPDLNEISYGDWDGLAWSDIAAAQPALSAAKLANWKDVTPPGGEPWSAFEQRVRGALARVLAGPLPAAIVAHAAVNAVLAEAVAGTDARSFTLNYCEVATFDV